MQFDITGLFEIIFIYIFFISPFRVLVDHLKENLGIHPKQVTDLKVLYEILIHVRTMSGIR